MRRLLPVCLLLVMAVPQACHRDEVTAPRTSPAAGGADPSTARIAFVSTRDGNREIYVMASDGSAQTRLTNVPEWDYEPSWSPDGNRIAFVSQRGRCDCLYVMAPDGSAVTTLTRHDSWWGDRRPTWAPDGQAIVFTRFLADNVDVYRIAAGGSAETALTPTLVPRREPDRVHEHAGRERRDLRDERGRLVADAADQRRGRRRGTQLVPRRAPDRVHESPGRRRPDLRDERGWIGPDAAHEHSGRQHGPELVARVPSEQRAGARRFHRSTPGDGQRQRGDLPRDPDHRHRRLLESGPWWRGAARDRDQSGVRGDAVRNHTGQTGRRRGDLQRPAHRSAGSRLHARRHRGPRVRYERGVRSRRTGGAAGVRDPASSDGRGGRGHRAGVARRASGRVRHHGAGRNPGRVVEPRHESLGRHALRDDDQGRGGRRGDVRQPERGPAGERLHAGGDRAGADGRGEYLICRAP